MGCVYSDHSKRSKSKNQTNNDDDNSLRHSIGGNNNTSASNSLSNRRIFQACSKNEKKHGQIEITDNELIFQCGDSKRLEWPLKYLRSYGGSNGLFSFECGRKCSTGPGIFVFDCPQAEQLLRALVRQIGVMANSNNNHTNNNQQNNQIDGHHQMAHSQPQINGPSLSSTTIGYQNTNNNEREITQQTNNNISRLDITETQQQPQTLAPHTYLNSTVIGQIKSQPNYYTPYPSSSSSSHSNNNISRLNESKHSLDETLNGSNSINHHWYSSNGGYDFRTLPSMRSSISNSDNTSNHNYINASVNPENRVRRSSENNDHLYMNHCNSGGGAVGNGGDKISLKKLQQIESKMDESDNLGTFCYVNFDQNNKNTNNNNKSSTIINGFKNRIIRATPESYVQLDLNNKSVNNNANNKNDDKSSSEKTISNSKDEDNSTNNQIKNSELSSTTSLSSTTTTTTTKTWRNHMVNGHHTTTNAIMKNEKPSSIFNNNSNINNDCNNIDNGKSQDNNNVDFNTNSTTTTVVNNNNNKTTTSVPYVEIDFAKTLALSNSAVNRKL